MREQPHRYCAAGSDEREKRDVVGASRGIGRAIVAAARAHEANVLAIARNIDSLTTLSQAVPGITVLAADASSDGTPERSFAMLAPDILVLCGGASPTMAPVQDQTWDQFSANWNSDVKASFAFCKAALRRPLLAGSTVVLISSGAALGGSHLSGSYAGAKRMQMFLAEYCQEQSDRLGLGIRFLALAPARIMPGTGLGKVAVAGYSAYAGISEEDFIGQIEGGQSPEQVVAAFLELITEVPSRPGTIFRVSESGLEEVA